MRRIILLLALASTASGAVVSTFATCEGANGFFTNYGTDRVSCDAAFTRYIPGFGDVFVGNAEHAAVSVNLYVGPSVTATTSGDKTRWAMWGDAEAYFSDQYVLTLTGGTNLIDFGNFGGTSSGAMFEPCLSAGGPLGGQTFARMSGGPWGDFYTEPGWGSTCDSRSFAQPLLLGVPMILQLTLQAHDALGSGASFNGFRFYGLGGPLDDAAFTFTDSPEPGTWAMMMSALLALRPILRHRRRHERHG